MLAGPRDTVTAEDQLWPEPRGGVGMPDTTAAARERRRHILLGLTGLAFATLLAAFVMRGTMIAVHIGVDALMLGYVILLVRHRQITAERLSKVEPIRPPVTQQTPASMQLAPSYLLQTSTGS